MKNKHKKVIFQVASATALVAFFWSGPEPQLKNENKAKRELSSVEDIGEIEVEDLSKTVTKEEVSNPVTVKTAVVIEKSAPPAPYFLSSDNFKKYDELLYKVVRSPAERANFRLSLLNHRSLEDAADYLKNPSAKPGKEEQIYHLKASGFLIKAISAHPTEFEVTQAVKEVLAINLSEAKSTMSEASYILLKENKAELMYHALAVSEEVQNTYSTDTADVESQKLLEKIQGLHAKNVSQSQDMIADR